MYVQAREVRGPGQHRDQQLRRPRPLHGEHREVRCRSTTSTPSGAAARSSSATAAAFAAFGTSSRSSGLTR